MPNRGPGKGKGQEWGPLSIFQERQRRQGGGGRENGAGKVSSEAVTVAEASSWRPGDAVRGPPGPQGRFHQSTLAATGRSWPGN